MEKEFTDKLIEVYKTILQQEVSNHTIFITVLLGIVIILLGATWWWNKSGASKEIKAEVDKRFEKEKKKLIKDLENNISNKVDDRIKDYKKQILEIDGNVARSMAISARNQNIYSHSIYWLSRFLDTQIELDHPKSIRDATEWILDDLELLIETDEVDNLTPVHRCDLVLKTITKLPRILEKEKKEILKKCKGREEKDD